MLALRPRARAQALRGCLGHLGFDELGAQMFPAGGWRKTWRFAISYGSGKGADWRVVIGVMEEYQG